MAAATGNDASVVWTTIKAAAQKPAVDSSLEFPKTLRTSGRTNDAFQALIQPARASMPGRLTDVCLEHKNRAMATVAKAETTSGNNSGMEQPSVDSLLQAGLSRVRTMRFMIDDAGLDVLPDTTEQTLSRRFVRMPSVQTQDDIQLMSHAKPVGCLSKSAHGRLCIAIESANDPDSTCGLKLPNICGADMLSSPPSPSIPDFVKKASIPDIMLSSHMAARNGTRTTQQQDRQSINAGWVPDIDDDSDFGQVRKLMCATKHAAYTPRGLESNSASPPASKAKLSSTKKPLHSSKSAHNVRFRHISAPSQPAVDAGGNVTTHSTLFRYKSEKVTVPDNSDDDEDDDDDDGGYRRADSIAAANARAAAWARLAEMQDDKLQEALMKQEQLAAAARDARVDAAMMQRERLHLTAATRQTNSSHAHRSHTNWLPWRKAA